MNIEGRRALITGASQGIGAELARGLRRAGADVALVARGAERLERLAAELDGRAYPCDLTDRAQLRDLVDQVEEDGRIDILVNNAGGGTIGRFAETSADTLEQTVALNVTATAELTRQVLPRMLSRGEGHIVNVSSLGATFCPAHLVLYAATKAFVSHFTANLEFELRDTTIGVTKVEIGEVTDTGLTDAGRVDVTFAAQLDRMYRLRLSRPISPQEVASATVSAIEKGRSSVWLPRRATGAFMLVDLPRRLTKVLSRDLPQGEGITAREEATSDGSL